MTNKVTSCLKFTNDLLLLVSKACFRLWFKYFYFGKKSTICCDIAFIKKINQFHSLKKANKNHKSPAISRLAGLFVCVVFSKKYIQAHYIIILAFCKVICNNWRTSHKLNDRGIKRRIYVLRLKRKKACNFNHFRRKCISSGTKWLYIINAKHCISSLRSFSCTLKRDYMQKRAKMTAFSKRTSQR